MNNLDVLKTSEGKCMAQEGRFCTLILGITMSGVRLFQIVLAKI